MPLVKEIPTRTTRGNLPKIWIETAGMLKGRGIDPLGFQRAIRKEWDERLKRQIALARRGKVNNGS